MRWSTVDRDPAADGVDTGSGGAPAPAAEHRSPRPEHPGTAPLSGHPAVVATATTLADLEARNGVQELPAGVRTPAELAAHLGVAPAAVATTALLTTGPVPGEGELILVVSSAVHDLVPSALAAVLGLATIDLVDDVEVLRRSGSVLGSASPVGLTDPLTTYVDVALAPHPTIWVPAGHPHAVFRTRYDELLRLTGGHPVEIG